MAGELVILVLSGLLASASCEGLLSSTSLIPQELINYFHPLSLEESHIWPGSVQRQRREVVEEASEGQELEQGAGDSGDSGDKERQEVNRKEQLTDMRVDTFRVSKKYIDGNGEMQEEMCLFIRTRADFLINFRTRPGAPVAVASKAYTLPEKPAAPSKVNGTCAMETETSIIFIFWSGFNFTIEFTKNPEGNSYYMNRAILVYDTEHPDLKKDFELSETHGKVHLETRPGKNFFFTPLGKSYLCYKAENQGPLKLWNLKKNEIEGQIDFSDTKFQPFVVRAHGEWGPTKKCLPLEIRLMREDFWPFVSACAVIFSSSLLVAVYGIKRTWFTEQKVDYGTYESANQDMEMVRQPDGFQEVPLNQGAKEQEAMAQQQEATEPTPFQGQAKSANPFAANEANPFH